MGPKSNKLSGNYMTRLTLLLTGSLTVLAGAGITAAIPEIGANFESYKNAAFLSKLLLTLPSFFIAILAPFAGKIIDSMGRKNILLISLFLYAIGGSSGFFLSNLYGILVSRAVLGIAVAGIMTINTTLIGDYFKGKQRSTFMGWQGAFMSFGGVVFVTVGGLLADISWRMPFLVYSLSLIILALSYFYIYEPAKSPKPKPDKRIPVADKKKWKYLLIYVSAFFGMLFFYILPTQVPFLLKHTGIESNASIGYLIGATILSGAIVSYNYGKIRLRLNFYQIYALTFLLMGIGYLMISIFDKSSGTIPGLIIAGLGTGMLMPNTNLWLISLAPAFKRGRMVGQLNFAVYAGQFISPIALFPMIHTGSIILAFKTCGALLLTMTIMYFLLDIISKKNTNTKNPTK